jgi:opacity protein-like surface antigen
MTLLVGCGSYANANTGQVTFEAGYRRDTIDWRQRFPSEDPFITSNLKFEDLDIFQIGIHGRTTVGCNFYVRGSAYWGWILDGDFKRSFNAYPEFYGFSDSNFEIGFGDNARSTVDDKYVFGIGAAIGYPFYFCDCSMILAPVIGYAFDEQNIRVDDEGFNFSDDYFALFGSNDQHCCRNTFISRWYGPFVGLDFDWRPYGSCFNIWAELEYHWGSFRGKRSHFDDFNAFDEGNRNSHDATAWAFALGLDYDLCNCWTIGISAKYQDWSANRHHRLCTKGISFSDFASDLCDHRSRTNHKWRSYAINLTFGRDF